MTDRYSAKRLGFPKSRRLTRGSEFERVRKNGTAQRGRFMVVSALQNDDGARFRAGFITSRKIGGAVTRNRVRRKLREIVRTHQHEISAGCWLVTIARSSAARASYEDLEGEWLRLAKRAFI